MKRSLFSFSFSSFFRRNPTFLNYDEYAQIIEEHDLLCFQNETREKSLKNTLDAEERELRTRMF